MLCAVSARCLAPPQQWAAMVVTEARPFTMQSPTLRIVPTLTL